MALTIQQMERRLRQVEKDLADLRTAFGAESKEPWYRQIAGSFAQDPLFAEAARLGRLIRKGKLKS